MRLGEVCNFQNGYAFKSGNFITDGDYKIVKIKELKNGEVRFFGDSASINSSSNLAQYEIAKGDVLFALTGDPVNKNNPMSWVGRVSIYNHEAPAYLNQRVCKAIPDNKELDSLYLYYYFRVFENFFSLAQRATGSASQANISTKTIGDINIELPPISEQIEIGRTLRTLDDKIANNTKINHHLEQMAQAIYAQTFTCCEDSITPLGELIDVRDGTHDSPKAVEQGFPLVTSKHLLPYGVDLIAPNHISKTDFDKINERSKVDRYDILISMIGTIGLISLVIEREINFAIKNVGLFKTSKAEEWVYFVLCFLRSHEVKNHIDMRLAGSTQKYISLGELRQLPVTVPTLDELRGFNDTVRPLFEEIFRRTEESSNLAVLRDTLLPRLMSGELSVADLAAK